MKEVEAQQIRNRGMVLQLEGLMEGVCLGYYVLDTFKFQSLEDECVPEDHQVSHKRLWIWSTTSKRKKTSLLAFGTDSIAMLIVCLDVWRLKFLMWGSLACYYRTTHLPLSSQATPTAQICSWTSVRSLPANYFRSLR